MKKNFMIFKDKKAVAKISFAILGIISLFLAVMFVSGVGGSGDLCPDGTSCNDGNACTVNDVCSDGSCNGDPIVCDDGNPCTTNSCDQGTGCVHSDNTEPCNDENECTTGDTCSGGTCIGGPAPDCDDSDPCTQDSCDPVSGCVNEPDPSCDGYDSTLILENKDGDWVIISGDNIQATLYYNEVGLEFEYLLEATGLQSSTSYSLIYYADKVDSFVNWGGNNPGALIATGTSKSDGTLALSGDIDLNMDLPSLPDINYDNGAKIWLVPTDALPATGYPQPIGVNGGWDYWEPHVQPYILFENNLITYLKGECIPSESRSCGEGDCAGTQTCQVERAWGDCSTAGDSCGTCETFGCGDRLTTLFPELGPFLTQKFYNLQSGAITCNNEGLCINYNNCNYNGGVCADKHLDDQYPWASCHAICDNSDEDCLNTICNLDGCHGTQRHHDCPETIENICDENSCSCTNPVCPDPLTCVLGPDADGDGWDLQCGDCDDTDSTIYDGAPEFCDCKDNDCDSATADGANEEWLGNACDGADSDLCTEGVYECSAGVKSCTDNTDDNLEICDGLDNDCDGVVPADEIDDDNDGMTECKGDCDDSVASCISDCTSLKYEDSDGDDYGNPAISHRACDAPVGYVSDNTDCDDSNSDIYPEATETCNGIDDDCDGLVDEDFTDLESSCSVGTGECLTTGKKICTNDGLGTKCNAIEGQPEEEICDGLDNDCDGEIDEEGYTLCDDSLWCNGAEICAGINGCQAGASIDVDDGVSCTEDSCDEDDNIIVNTPINANCDDTNECTDNICDVDDDCVYPNMPSDTPCGQERNCPLNVCFGSFANFFPTDSHDTCDGDGTCVEYSCGIITSYCCDNDDEDGISGLLCGAECDQDSDCGPELIGTTCYYDSEGCDLELTCGCDYKTKDCPEPGYANEDMCYWDTQECVDVDGCTLNIEEIEDQEICDPDLGPVVIIELEEGWNLISIPIVPEDDSIEIVLIGANVSIVYAYNPFDPDEDNRWVGYNKIISNGDLETMNAGHGYWVLANSDTKIRVKGDLMSEVITPPSIDLASEWNLIGHYGLEDKEVYCSLFSLIDTTIGYPRWSALFGYDEMSDEFISLNVGSQTNPEEGYWIEMDVEDSYNPSTTCWWGFGPQ